MSFTEKMELPLLSSVRCGLRYESRSDRDVSDQAGDKGPESAFQR